MTFNQFKEILQKQVFEHCDWDEDEWNDSYTVCKLTLRTYNPEYLISFPEDQIVIDWAKEFFQESTRDGSSYWLKSEFVPKKPFGVVILNEDDEVHHEIVNSTDRITALESVMLSLYVNKTERDLRKLWFKNLYGLVYEDIEKELYQENVVVSCIDIEKELKSLKK